jgi:hypothetical protein
MKKIIAVLMFTGLFSTVTNAQTPVPASKEAKPEMSKEEKAKQKMKQDEEMAAAFKEVGLSEDQIKQVKEVNTEASKKSSEIKKDDSLSDEAKKEKNKEVNSEKAKKLKEIMGEDKYKQFNDIRKKQKEAAQPKM